jgi:hypothetical protein
MASGHPATKASSTDVVAAYAKARFVFMVVWALIAFVLVRGDGGYIRSSGRNLSGKVKKLLKLGIPTGGARLAGAREPRERGGTRSVTAGRRGQCDVFFAVVGEKGAN